MMIRREQLDDVISSALPDYVDEWGELAVVDGETLHHVTATSVAEHIIALYEAGHTHEVRRAFAMIERLHVEGDEYVREVATVGFLETLQASNSYQGQARPVDLEAFLGPESRRWWRGVHAFLSDGRTPIRPVDDPPGAAPGTP